MIEVDIAKALAQLEASPELAQQMNELVGGPELVRLQNENEQLRELLRDVRDNGLIYWETQTSRGGVQKALMLKRIDDLIGGRDRENTGPPAFDVDPGTLE